MTTIKQATTVEDITAKARELFEQGYSIQAVRGRCRGIGSKEFFTELRNEARENLSDSGIVGRAWGEAVKKCEPISTDWERYMHQLEERLIWIKYSNDVVLLIHRQDFHVELKAWIRVHPAQPRQRSKDIMDLVAYLEGLGCRIGKIPPSRRGQTFELVEVPASRDIHPDVVFLDEYENAHSIENLSEQPRS